jgi:hypothetical protein
MAENLYTRCSLCHGTLKIDPAALVCDYPASMQGACLCTHTIHPGWEKTGLTLGQVERALKAERALPDLLAACEATLPRLIELRNYRALREGQMWAQDFNDAIDLLQSAIARATGKE